MTRGFLPALLLSTMLALTASRGVHAASPETSAAGDVKRGEYVVAIGSCNDCHGMGGRIGRPTPACFPVRMASTNIASVHLPRPDASSGVRLIA